MRADGNAMRRRQMRIGRGLTPAVTTVARISASATPPMADAAPGAIWAMGPSSPGAIRKARLPMANRPAMKVIAANTTTLAMSPAETPAAE